MAEPAHNAAIEADPMFLDDGDSTYGDDDAISSSYTASMTNDIDSYRMENGRRYHAFKHGSYILPNDEIELDRLDLIHHMLKIIMGGKLFLAPVPDLERVLDIGTGTGIWPIEMGDEYPSAQIIGTDIAATQPAWVPVNVRFEIDDAESTWDFKRKFDLIHLRYLAAAISDWPRLLQQCFENTKPGGFCEFHEFDMRYYSEDGSLKEDQAVSKWMGSLLEACQQFGRDPCPGPKLEGYARAAGFYNVAARKVRLPIGPWAKDRHLKQIGSWNLVQIEQGLEAMTLRLFTTVLKWEVEEVQVLLANVRKDIRDHKIHAQFDFWVVYGQRPHAV